MRRVLRGMQTGLVLVSIAFVPIIMNGETPGGNPAAKKLKNPERPTPDSIAAGQKTFQKFCAFCHGPEAKGDGPMAPKDSHPSDLTDNVWDHGSSDGEIFAVVRDGSGPQSVMKGFKGKLTEQDMWNIVNYLRSIGPKKR